MTIDACQISQFYVCWVLGPFGHCSCFGRKIVNDACCCTFSFEGVRESIRLSTYVFMRDHMHTPKNRQIPTVNHLYGGLNLC